MIENEDFDNQIEENEEDYDILALDDEADEETAELDELEAEDNEVEEADKEIEKVETADPLDDLEIKFLHESKKLKDIPRDELKTLVQKGMNHDRLTEKIEGFKQLEGKMSEFEELASFYGMTTDELKESLFNSFFENKASEDGVTAELLRREYTQNKKESSEKQAEQLKSKQDKDMNDFISKYPNVKGDDVEPETWELINNGMSLTQAYEKQIGNKEVATLKAKIAELEGKQKTIKQNADVKQKAVVKSTLTHGTDDSDNNDDFLAGLFGK